MYSPIQCMKKTDVVFAKESYLLVLIKRGRALKPYLLYYVLLNSLGINNLESVLN